ncbi:hypothetical protein CONPUDRAFT_138676 [Coniophora puteana RWD-64-598 SS2]|uniref:Chromo domain-containing protein n=1 Tax=Coniophora puteana (strain RWD-64-598) TaxID=741705 RepID=A0A5M3MH91_CONPW|nr:uncharacterized protein CONPUDRAFT_138676 [Coniophora puteana RWD-64-598 SS2]EIW78376.1 hypothetical protein CONPUDRAFT_138676 [Coniophora puteana RWD-64-598 SS2]
MFFAAAPYAQLPLQPDYSLLLERIKDLHDDLQAARIASDERLLNLEGLMKEAQNATADTYTKIQSLQDAVTETKDAVKDARDASERSTEAIREQLVGVQEKLDHVVTIQETPNEIAPAASAPRRESATTNPDPLWASVMNIEELERKTSGNRRSTEEPFQHDHSRRNSDMTTWDASCMHSTFMSVDASGQRQPSKSLTPVNWSHNRNEPQDYASQDSSRENTPSYPPGSDLDLAPYKIVTERSASPDDTMRALRRSVLGDSVAGAVVLDPWNQRESASVLPPPLAHVPSTPPLPSPPPTTSPDPRRVSASSVPPRYSETPSLPDQHIDSDLPHEPENVVEERHSEPVADASDPVLALELQEREAGPKTQGSEPVMDTSDPTTTPEPQESEPAEKVQEFEYTMEAQDLEPVAEAKEFESAVMEPLAIELVVEAPAVKPIVEAQGAECRLETQEMSDHVTETERPDIAESPAPEDVVESPQPELGAQGQTPEHNVKTPSPQAPETTQEKKTEPVVNPPSSDAEVQSSDDAMDNAMLDSPPESTSTDRDQEEADVILALMGGASAHSSPIAPPQTPRLAIDTLPLSSPLTALSSSDEDEDESMATEKPSPPTSDEEDVVIVTPKFKRKSRRKKLGVRAGDHEEEDDDDDYNDISERALPRRPTSVIPPPRPSTSLRPRKRPAEVVDSSEPPEAQEASPIPDPTLDEILEMPEKDRSLQHLFRLTMAGKGEGQGAKRKAEVLPTSMSASTANTIKLGGGRRQEESASAPRLKRKRGPVKGHAHTHMQEESASAPPLKKKRAPGTGQGHAHTHMPVLEESASAPPPTQKRKRGRPKKPETIAREKQAELERLRVQQQQGEQTEGEEHATLPGQLQRSLTGLGRHNKEKAAKTKKGASAAMRVKAEPETNTVIPPPRPRGRPRKSEGSNNAGPSTVSTERMKSEGTVDGYEWPPIEDYGELDGFSRQLIQCDNCDVWYHFVCVGISAGDPRLAEGVLFICPPCTLEPARRISLRNRTESCGRPKCQLSPAAQEFFMERIIGRRRCGQAGFKWLVKWDGFPITMASWITEGQMTDNSVYLFRDFCLAARDENIDLEEPQEVVLLKEATKGEWAWEGDRCLIPVDSD